jgi:hypothetical protein
MERPHNFQIRTSSRCNATASISASESSAAERPSAGLIPRHTSQQPCRRLLRTKLYVDNYCTKEQLRIRHSKWGLFRQLQARGMHPFFNGEQVYHYPVGSRDPTLYTEEQAATSEEQLQQPQQHQPLQRQQLLPQHNQQQQPHQGQAALPSTSPAPCDIPSPAATTTSTPPPPATAPTDATSRSPVVVAEALTSAAATVAAQGVLQPSTRGNVPSIQQTAKAPLDWKKQKLPADASVFKDKSKTRSGCARTRTTAG